MAPVPPAPGQVAELAADAPLASIFAADVPGAADALLSDPLLRDAPLDLLAELAAHARTETPLTIGLLGPAGSGKSTALVKLADAISALSAAAGGASETPFLTQILTLRMDAADLDGAPATALAGALYARLAADCPALALEAMHAARDPRLAAREAFERLHAARHKLEAERQALEAADARRAKLTDTVLYEAAGSQVDAYASANRAGIKNAMARFGVGGDPIVGYKDMIRAIVDGGGGGRASFALGAFWALKGQTRLIVMALLLLLAGLGLGAAVAEQTVWLGWLRANDQLASAANWLEDHMDWLANLRQLAFLGAALALGANIWRALRLLQLVFRGESLLRADLSARRRESDGHFGHQSRRVQDLAAEVDILARRASDAERRAGGPHPALAEAPPFAGDVVKQQAQRFIAAVGALIQKRGRSKAKPNGESETPQRIVVALDNLDAAPIDRARDILMQLRGLLGPGFVTLIAADPTRFNDDSSEDLVGLDKWIGAPLQVGAMAARAGYAGQVHEILGGAAPKPPIAVRDARRSALDEPMADAEGKLLADLAPLAGSSARAVKRFVNLYRLLRTQAQDRPDQRGALALMLALDAGGSAAEIAAMNDALSSARGEMDLDLQKGGLRLAEALAAAQSAQGRISVDAARRAAATARLFSMNASR